MGSPFNGNLSAESGSTTEIRAPIPQRRMTLYEASYSHIEDLDYNLRPRNQDIFQKGTFQSVRTFAQISDKWLLVNIEPSMLTEWQLDRILIQNDELKNLISQHFVVWQECQYSREGRKYINLYGPVDFPYFGVINPATERKVVEFNSLGASGLYEFISQFILGHQGSTGEFSSDRVSDCPSEMKQTGYAQETSNIPDARENTRMDTSEDTRMDTSGDTSDTMNLSKNNSKGDSDPNLDFVIRCPNGERQDISWPGTSTLESLKMYVQGMGYDMKEYEIIAMHPHRCLTEQDLVKTLEEVLIHREVLFLQLKMKLSN